MSALITIPGIGRFKPLKPGKIHIRCRKCKKTVSNIARHDFDLPGSAVMVTNFCTRCDKGGGFEDTEYFDLQGKAISPI